MMEVPAGVWPWIYGLLSVTVVSLLSFAGVFSLSFRDSFLRKVLLFFVSFSAGALLGGAFIHLIPEVIEEFGFSRQISLYILSGIVASFVLEKIIHWRHCHMPTTKKHPHPFAIMNLFGDGVHNFIDGLIIGTSYLAGIPVGIATTIAVILHEIPQEIGDFGVLLHGGFRKKKALFLNFLTALTALLGLAVSIILGSLVEGSMPFLLSFAAGTFIYIASSDLIPEPHNRSVCAKFSPGSFVQLFFILLGIGVMMLLLFL